MIRALIGDLPIQYILLRVGNVAIRPLLLFMLSTIWDGASVSIIALSLTFGAWLMVPMSFGSYRWVLPIEQRYKDNAVFGIRAKRVYSLVVTLSIVAIIPVIYQISASIMGNAYAGILAAEIVVYDFLTHERSRRILYGGQLTRWAIFLLSRNVLLPVAWFSGFAIASVANHQLSQSEYIKITVISTLPPIAYAISNFFLNHMNFGGWKALRKNLPVAWRRIGRYWQYAAIGILSKSHQHIDKLVTAIIFPQYVWVVALVNYLASIPVTAYEMINLARLKSEVLKLNAQKTAQRNKVSRRDVLTFFVFAIPSGILIFGFVLNQGFSLEAPILAISYITFSWFFVISLKRAELVFWSVKNKWVPFRIDFAAGSVNVAIALVLPMVDTSIMLVKLSAIIGAVVKNTWAKALLDRGTNGKILQKN